MKTILGLDLGVSSVGVAVIQQENDKTEIKHLAVRIVPEDPNFHGKFYSGNTASKNLERTTQRSIRRNNQRYKIRRDELSSILKENNMFPDEQLLNLNTFELYQLRAKAVTEKITLKELGRIFLLLNQRRGFLSNRKSQTEEENSTEYKQKIELIENELGNKTIGQKLFEELQNSEHINSVLLRERTYLRSTYIEEFDRIWDKQQQYHTTILTGNSNEDNNNGNLYDIIRNRIIYYQRPLKSQKGLVSECLFENHHKAITKSSPYFEQFRIWQKLNDLSWKTEDGITYKPTLDQKQKLFDELFYKVEKKSKYKLTVSKIKLLLGFNKNQKIYLNFTELDGSRTFAIIRDALIEAKINNFNDYLFFNPFINDEKGGLFELWHITYSLPTDDDIAKTLIKRFDFSLEQAYSIAKNIGYSSDYGKLSTKAIKKILPYLQQGLQYSEACDNVGYDHSGYKSKIEIQHKLKPILQNSLRNPVVEQILNQLVNTVNLIIDKYGKIDEVRIELARELRNNAKTRKKISTQNSNNKKNNDIIRYRLLNEYNFKVVNGRDIKRYILWQETNEQCLYCNNPISTTEFLTGQAEIEHILPKSRSFSNNMNNFILAHKRCNTKKGQLTAYDFMSNKEDEEFKQYIERINKLYADGKGKISKQKFENLMYSGNDIPSDFVERMKNDTQHIVVETVKLLKTVCENVYTTTGQITDFLRDKWELKLLLEELSFDTYKTIGQIEYKDIKDKTGNIKSIEKVKDWSKRDDHRHHAIDALICALTNQKIIFKLNNLNKLYQLEQHALSKEEIEEIEKTIDGEKFNLKTFADLADTYFDSPIPKLREKAKEQIEAIIVSIKKTNSKVLSKNINQAKNKKNQITWTPRGRLHEDTIMGKVKRISDKKAKLTPTFNQIENIVHPQIKELIIQHLSNFENNPKIAFDKKTLSKSPITYNNETIIDVQVYEEVLTKRVNLNENFTTAQVEKIIDKRIQKIIQNRIEEFGNIKKAFSNLIENPIWLNKEKGIKIQSVKVFDESKVEKVRDGYAKLGNNHHALIYKNDDGKYNDKVVSFWEAVEIGKLNIEQTGKPYPIINRKDDITLGQFQFSVQINDLFVFDLKHSENPTNENELNFFDLKNKNIISKKLFRVQKMSKGSSGQFIVDFRHHLETSVNRNDVVLRGITWEKFQANNHFSRITKIKVNHLGEIIKVGE